MALTPKQQAFAREYLVDLNATQAAIRAGYSPKTADKQGSQLLKQAEIAAAVEAGMAARAKRLEITADRVLEEIARLAYSDVGDAFDSEGALKQPKDMPENFRRAVASVETDELFEGHGEDRKQVGVTRKVKLWDKTRNLELLAKHLGLVKDRLEHTLDGSFAQLLKEARERARSK